METTLAKPKAIRRVSPSSRSKKAAATKLRELRLNRGLSPEQVGTYVGLSGNTIRNIEAGVGSPTVRTMFALAEFYDLKVTELWRP